MIVTETKKRRAEMVVFAEKVGKNLGIVGRETFCANLHLKFLLKSYKAIAVSILGKWKYW